MCHRQSTSSCSGPAHVLLRFAQPQDCGRHERLHSKLNPHRRTTSQPKLTQNGHVTYNLPRFQQLARRTSTSYPSSVSRQPFARVGQPNPEAQRYVNVMGADVGTQRKSAQHACTHAVAHQWGAEPACYAMDWTVWCVPLSHVLSA